MLEVYIHEQETGRGKHDTMFLIFFFCTFGTFLCFFLPKKKGWI